MSYVDVDGSNTYLRDFIELCSTNDFDPYGGDPSWESTALLSSARKSFVQKFSWAVPNNGAVSTIAEQGKVIEIGAGSGYWSMLVAAAGADVLAFDRYPASSLENGYTSGVEWFDVQIGGPYEAANHSDRALLLCWPPVSSLAYDSLMAYTGDTVFYVGEPAGGCTADDDFFDLLEKDFVMHDLVDIPTWPYIRDRLYEFRRR